jgi:hypothetical protein
MVASKTKFEFSKVVSSLHSCDASRCFNYRRSDSAC